ncbi:MAG: PEP-CTERM sorting domain-containing protein [Thiobacillus sp.]|nr:PEP-CTERM sorting domain-containing protein [Thiobacillus sp.]
MTAHLSQLSSKRGWLQSAAIMIGLGAMVMADAAVADSYNFWLKKAPNTPYVIGAEKCATGEFTYTKSGVTLGDAVANMSMSIAQDCRAAASPAVALTMTGTLNVVVRDINLNGEYQGPNVDGLTGTLASQQFEKNCKITSGPFTQDGHQLAQWEVTFKSQAGAGNAPGVRQFDLVERVGRCVILNATPNFNTPTPLTLVSNGPYHVYNTIVRPAPEPETLWLLLGGLGALALIRRKVRRH